VIEALDRIWREPGCYHDHSVPNIMRSIERSDARAAFPHKRTTFHVAIHDVLDRLKRRGVVTTTTTGKPGRQVRHATLIPPKVTDITEKAFRRYPPPKPLIDQRLALEEPAHRPLIGHRAGERPDAEPKWLGKVEVLASAVPHERAQQPIEHRLDQKEDDMRQRMTEEQWRLEVAYLKQRIAALEAEAGVRDDPPPVVPVEPIGDNVVRLPRK
jgi:hypothetical protein